MKITCGIFLIDTQTNRLLICKPNNSENFWSIPKGIAEDDEEFFDAAKRELYEETGIKYNKLEIDKVVDLDSIKYEKRNKMLHSYAVYINEDIDNIKLKCKSMIDNDPKKGPEVIEFKWVTPEVALKMLHESQVRALKMI